jgi:hypothetical protein
LSQYCSLYYSRLKQLKGAVKEAAELKWDKVKFMGNVLDMK